MSPKPETTFDEPDFALEFMRLIPAEVAADLRRAQTDDVIAIYTAMRAAAVEAKASPPAGS